MSVQIGTATTAVFGAAGSYFGSVINLNSTGTNKTLNAANYTLLTGRIPGLAWFSAPVGGLLEVTHDGGGSWWPVIGVGGNCSGVWFVDGFTSRTGGSAGNWSVVFLTSQQS